MTKIDLLDLGCPELPEGQYYNVYFSNSEGSVYLSVYNERKRLWAKRVFHTYDYPRYIDGEREAIDDIIRRLAEEYPREVARRAEVKDWYDNARKYKGDHK